MESAPNPERQIAGRSLDDWHSFMTTDHNGESTAHLATPGSRYGRDADDTAWWAVAGLAAYEAAGGDLSEPDEAERTAEHFMSLSVNDHSDVVELVWEYEASLPRELLERLYGREEMERHE